MSRHEVQLEQAEAARELAERREIAGLRREALAESRRGWRGIVFTAADTLADSVVYAIALTIWGTLIGLVLLGVRVTPEFFLLVAGVPFATLTLALAIIAGPLHSSDTARHRRIANIVIVVWIVASMTFLIGVLYAIAT